MTSKKVRFHIKGWSHSTNNSNPEIMPDTHLDYFTCTLGEAAKWNEAHPHPFETVNHLVDEQADELRERPAVTFPGGCNGEDGRPIKSGMPALKTPS